jgi:hypothetical protein
MTRMTMKKALAIGFGGLKASEEEMIAAAKKLQTTKSTLHAAAYANRAALLVAKPKVEVGRRYETKHGPFTVTAIAEYSVDVQHDDKGRVARYALSDFVSWISPENDL